VGIKNLMNINFLKVLAYTKKLNFPLWHVTPKNLTSFLHFLSKSEDFNAFTLLDLVVVDNLKFYSDYRFQVTYLLYSYVYQKRFFVRVSFFSRVFLDSIVDIFPSANWLEREAWGFIWRFF